MAMVMFKFAKMWGEGVLAPTPGSDAYDLNIIRLLGINTTGMFRLNPWLYVY